MECMLNPQNFSGRIMAQEVDKQQQGNHADNDVYHGVSYSFSQKRTYSALTTKNATMIPT